MSKLDSIPKKDFLQAPDGYFDSLSHRINKRLEKPEAKVLWFHQPAFRIAIASVVIAVFGWVWSQNNQVENAENLLASIETEDLIAYLAEEENLDNLISDEEISNEDVQAIEAEVFEQTLDDSLLKNYIEELDENTF
ncbi:MAG: hypothetical protein O9340_13895 [Cyclobacteriaceae bacterium]|jgi:hypothetical protein|nr:hypothetical protein [Cyclobacteriaceae bacterium]